MGSRKATEIDGLVESETANGKAIVIRLEAVGKTQTHVSIRVGTFGDEEVSNRILDEIRAALGG